MPFMAPHNLPLNSYQIGCIAQVCYQSKVNVGPGVIFGSGRQMQVIKTDLPEVLIVEPKLFCEQSGFFLETYQLGRYVEHGIVGPFVQDNMSRSTYGVLRGLHLQNPSTQGKLVSAMRGRVLDVAVSVRGGSPNCGRHVAIELSEDNRRQLWVPRGFAHGFVVLSDTADFFYKCDNAYSPKDEIVVRWDDPAIGINWGMDHPSLSSRDAAAPVLAEVKNLPIYGQV